MNTVILNASVPHSVTRFVLGLPGVMVTVMMRKKTAAKKLNAWSPLTGLNHTHTKSTTIRVTYKDGSN